MHVTFYDSSVLFDNNLRLKMKFHSKITWLLFAAVTIALYLFALDVPLLGPDEPRYAEVAREMYMRGDWITPTLGGFDWFEKPALLYWLEIISFHLFGVNEFAARFGPAIFGLLTIVSLWFFGKLLQENSNSVVFQNEKKYDLANWMALFGATSLGLLVFSRAASFDIILTLPIAVALISFYTHLIVPRNSFSYYPTLIKLYIWIGIALIAKGLVGAIFPFAIITFYFVIRRRIPSKTILLSLLWGIPLLLIVASIWYLPMYLRNGQKFIDIFFIQHHFQRFSSNKYLHPQPFWFFWIVLPLMTLPWIAFIFCAIRELFKRWKNGGQIPISKNGEANLFDTQIFALAWILVPLLFFSISGSKLPGYILPALPAAIVFLGISAFRFIHQYRHWELSLKFLAAAMFVFIAFLLRFELPKFAQNDTVKFLVEAADSQGLQNDKILNLQTISHNVEFYGAGRLVRNADGNQRQFASIVEIEEFMRANSLPSALVLASNNSASKEIPQSQLKANVIAKNTELTIFELKQ